MNVLRGRPIDSIIFCRVVDSTAILYNLFGKQQQNATYGAREGRQ